MTNQKFAKESELFQEHCKEANCKPSMRQASKYRHGKGIAYKVWKKQAKPLEEGMGGYHV